MKICADSDIWQFKQYAVTVGDSSIIRTQVAADHLGKRSIRIMQASDDRLYSLFRTKTAKLENACARDLFYNSVAKLFGGSDRIPPHVRSALTNFGGNNEKPLTARRIRRVIAAIESLPDPVPVERPVVTILQEEPEKKQAADPISDFIAAKNEADKEMQEEASGKKSIFSSIKSFSFTGFLSKLVSSGGSNAKPADDAAPKKPAVKIFSTKMVTGTITYEDKPADGTLSPGTCEDIRLRFVASVESALKANGIPNKHRADYIRKLREALLADEARGMPLEVDDPNVKDALEFASSKDTKYNDKVSTSVANRGTVKVDTAKFLSSMLVQNLLGVKLGGKGAVSWSGVSADKGENGFLNLTIRDLKFNESENGGVLFNVLKGVVNGAKGKVDQVTIPLKPAYDPKSGKLSVTIGKISSDNELLAPSLSLSKDTILGMVSTSEQAAIRNAELSDEEKAGECFAKIELNLRRMGTEKLVGLNLNESFGANLKDIEFSEKGVVARFGDNVLQPEGGVAGPGEPRVPAGDQVEGDDGDDDMIAGFANDPSKDVGGNPADDSDASVTIPPEAYSRVVEGALRGKLGFTSFGMRTVPGTNGGAGRFDVSLDGVDLSGLAGKGGWKAKLARKLGFLNPGNVRFSLRPTVDPVSKRVRLDVVSLSYGDGLKNFLAKKFLPTVLSGILSGKVNGAGVASGPEDCVASISMDPAQVLEKLAIKIPGEVPEIKTVEVGKDGLSVGIRF